MAAAVLALGQQAMYGVHQRALAQLEQHVGKRHSG